jgi:FkbM family methyltransferase
MKINYFDLGLYKAVELGWMVNSILPSLGMYDYKVYGFEASEEYARNIASKFRHNDKVLINNLAISGEETTLRLYHSKNLLGHSIYSSKNNVQQDVYEEAESTRFSEWIKKNNVDLQNSFNIMKVNIEGAEWPLFQDLVANDLVKHFDIFCGAGHDVEKIGEFESIVDDYYKLLKDNNIEIHRFTEWQPHLNKDISRMIFEKYGCKSHPELAKIKEIDDVEIPEKYRKIWEDVSRPVQLRKAKNHNLSKEQTEVSLSQLVARPTYLCDIASMFDVQNIAEVGTAQGLQSYTFAEHIKSNNIAGHVWTCDIVNVRNKEYEKKYADVVTFCDGDSEKMSADISSSGKKVDLFYIDGAHGAGDVIKDVFHLRKVQSDNPVWIFDDYDERFGCYQDINKIMKIAKKFKVYSVGQTASGNPNHQVVVYGKL